MAADYRANANPIDVHVGLRLRLRRTLLGMSQGMLGKRIGLTFQQVQKYESGANRMCASRLWDAAAVLGVEIGWFFEDMPERAAQQSPRHVLRTGQQPRFRPEQDPRNTRETLELLRAYYGVDDALVRRRLVELIRVMAGSESLADAA